jgi:hypothetical protein
MIQFFLAQEGSTAAAQVIEQSLNLSRGISASWDETWQTLLQEPNDFSLWTAIVRFSLTIAVLALIYYAVSQGNDILKTQSFSKIIEMFVTPLVVIFLLGGNGFMLANIILAIRGVGRSLITSILQLQLGGISMEQAINQVINNQFAVQRIRQVFQECATLTGEPLTQCLQSKQAEAQGIVDALSQQSNVPLQAAQALINLFGAVMAVGGGVPTMVQGAFSQIIQSRAVPIIQVILLAIQWAFVNMAEAALLLSALFAPIAVAMMLIPLAGNALIIWFCGFVSILGIQLGYVLLVGFMASVLVATDAQNAIASAGDYGFLLFIAIFAPWIAYALGKGGGEQLYHGISQRAARLAQAGVQIIASGVKLAAGVF